MASNDPQNFCMIAGEVSGDRLGSLLVRELQRLLPTSQFSGIGGENLDKCGMDLWETTDTMAVMGFTDVLRSLPKFRRILRKTEERIIAIQPAATILVDYPGFNLKLAERLHRNGIAVCYYVVPQLWAWGKKRVRSFQNCIDKTIAVFPFEVEYFEQNGAKAEYFGHPFSDEIAELSPRTEARERLGLTTEDLIIGLLPGSRMSDVRHMLPVMIEASNRLQPEFHHVAAIGRASSLQRNFLEGLTSGNSEIKIVEDSRLLLRAADLVITKSGTVTTEAAMIGTPIVVAYRTGTLNYLVARSLVGVPFIAMPNLIAKRRIVPELIQNQASGANIAKEASRILRSPDVRGTMKADLLAVAKTLGPFGAARRAAEDIIDWLTVQGQAIHSGSKS